MVYISAGSTHHRQPPPAGPRVYPHTSPTRTATRTYISSLADLHILWVYIPHAGLHIPHASLHMLWVYTLVYNWSTYPRRVYTSSATRDGPRVYAHPPRGPTYRPLLADLHNLWVYTSPMQVYICCGSSCGSTDWSISIIGLHASRVYTHPPRGSTHPRVYT